MTQIATWWQSRRDVLTGEQVARPGRDAQEPNRPWPWAAPASWSPNWSSCWPPRWPVRPNQLQLKPDGRRFFDSSPSRGTKIPEGRVSPSSSEAAAGRRPKPPIEQDRILAGYWSSEAEGQKQQRPNLPGEDAGA